MTCCPWLVEIILHLLARAAAHRLHDDLLPVGRLDDLLPLARRDHPAPGAAAGGAGDAAGRCPGSLPRRRLLGSARAQPTGHAATLEPRPPRVQAAGHRRALAGTTT